MSQENPSAQPTKSTQSIWRRRWPFGGKNDAVDIEAQTSSVETGGLEAPSPPLRRQTHPFYQYSANYDIGSKGWAYVARMQNWVENGPLHRRFGVLTQRELHYYEGRLEQIEKRLSELDDADERDGGSELRGLSPWQLGLLGEDGERVFSEKDRLLLELSDVRRKYSQTLQDDVNLRAMDLMDRDSVHVLVSNIMENKVLDKSAMGQFENIDDYVTTRNQNLSFRGLLFPRIYRPQGPVLKFLTKFFVDHQAPEGSTFRTHYRSDRIMAIFRLIYVMTVVLPFVLPMSVLYFANPSKLASALVVIIPGCFLTWLMTGLPGRKFDQTFIASAAYLAVLSTLMANFQSSGSSQGTN